MATEYQTTNWFYLKRRFNEPYLLSTALIIFVIIPLRYG